MKMSNDWVDVITSGMIGIAKKYYDGDFKKIENERIEKGMTVRRVAWDMLHYIGGRNGHLLSALYDDGLDDDHIATGSVYCYKRLI